MKMKMTIPIPEKITTPDKVTTPIGTLEFFDGIPVGNTKEKVYGYMDRARAVQIYVDMMPAVSTYSLLQGSRDMGMGKSHQVVLWEQLGDSKSLVLTGNTSTMYAVGFLDLLKDGPTVIDLPPGMLGILDDMAFQYMTDLGVAGPDKGKGGKFLVLPAADLLLSNSYNDLMYGVIDIKDLGSGVIGGVECDYLAFRTNDVDWQIWIAQGKRPYPCRYVITSKHLSSGPQYTIQFRDWKTDSEVAATDFRFKNPTKANKVELKDLKGTADLPDNFKKGGAK